MRRACVWLRRLLGLFDRGERDRELAAELESHLQLHTDDNRRAGMAPDEARRNAMLRLGGLEPIRQAYRDTATIPIVEHMWQDAHFAVRQLRRQPGFSVVAVLLLALGSGASVAIFGFVDAALLKPLPYANPTRVVEVTEATDQIPRANLSYLDYLDWKRLNTVFTSLDVHNGRGFMLRTPAGARGRPRRARQRRVLSHARASSLPSAVTFVAGEDRADAPPVVMLSHAAWQKRFGRRDDVVGRPVTLNGIA